MGSVWKKKNKFNLKYDAIQAVSIGSQHILTFQATGVT